ncbi:hypothetical protein GDO78_004230 [Eleutherodactylus coqui]|uniref:C2H2-type domain-containing protein n=1 Tax=Eleutherodactylus coqui TaxID=57060 RepID=A0A8J6JZG4_ELECQ|nr:hypothetical protein GDO78_004230 [Eleutherodactylus coqui]
MTKHPPNRRGISFEVGAQLEARDRLKKWYAAHIEEIDYEEGKVFRVNEQVLACWSDCRFYPAKITSVNKDGTYTVKFFDGVIQTVKNIHVKAFSKDQAGAARSRQRERPTDSTSPSDKHRGKFREQRKSSENTTIEKEKPQTTDKKAVQSDKDKKPVPCEKSKVPSVKNEKEDKENISENERDSSAETRPEERNGQNDSLKAPHENGDRRRKRDRSSSLTSDPSSQTLQPVTLELRRRKISIASETHTKRPRLEKITNTLKKPDDPAAKAVNLEMDANRFKCKILDCSKSFRKAKLLHYHMKYFHGVEKAEQDQMPVTRHMQTRGSLAHERNNQQTSKRRRTTSGSLHPPFQISLRSSPHDGKGLIGEKRRHSSPATNSSNLQRPTLKEKSKENQIQKSCRRPERGSENVKDKVKEKFKDLLSLKSKKKKKRTKSELSGSEENVDISKELSPKKASPVKLATDYKISCSMKTPDPTKRRDVTKLSDEETLSDSCTESLLWSEEDDDDYNEEIDVTNADEDMEDGEAECEIVRCMCEVQEENDFMIQCEECLCWQHGVCMGLLEDTVPEKYTCYVCQDPPGISKEHPDLRFWGQPWKQHTLNDRCYIRRTVEENSWKDDSTNYRTYNGAVDKPSPIPSVEESYITSEHCYQKPRTYYPAVEQRLVVETRSSSLDGGVDRIRQNREDSIAERLGWELDRELLKVESESKHNYCKVRECLSKRNPPQESLHPQPADNGDATVSSQLQWQLNLLTHLESLQDEVTHRMDFIEKELDVLESFLDYTGELEPPEPLARLPQLKHRIKQLLMDLGKVEQIALCST